MYKAAVFITDHTLRQDLVAALAEAGCTLFVPKPNDDWLELICSNQPQFVFIDPRNRNVDMPELARTLKRHDGFSNVRVIAVLIHETAATLRAEWGVSDVVFPPFSSTELSLRMNLVMWRHNLPSADDTIHAGPVTVDLASYEVTVGGRPVSLTYREYELLRFLMTHPGRVHTRSALLNQVWGYDYFGGTRTVDVHVRRLREKLGLEAAEQIETVRNVGYRFIERRAGGKRPG